MRYRPLLVSMLATPLVLAGCMRQMASSDMQTSFSAVSVRFAMPADFTGASATEAQAMMQDGVPFGGAMSASLAAQKDAAPNSAFHVALWGGPFHGCDVTNTVASLTPGSYTFALFDQNNSSFVQGWADVNGTGIGTLDMLLRWRNGVQEERQMLAYDMELQGKTPAHGEAALTEFADAMQAFDRLEKQIDSAIAKETKAQASRRQSLNEFLGSAELLLMPTERPTFHSATQAAFTDQDLNMVRSGNAVSKFVLLADHGTSQWKLRQVNRLYRELTHARAVQWQIVERLQRRKGRFLMTDHLFHDDAGFITNETNLQNTLAAVERMDQRMAELRDRRMALAFVSELITNDGTFTTLEQERSDLLRERAQFEARKNRYDRMFEETGETSPTRVALEGSRQRVAATLEMIDHQIAQLGEARTAVEAMVQATEVIHRQGDKRLLTATYVGQDMPFRVRDIIEREAMMTLRMEPSTSVFAPRPTSLTAAGQAPSACPWPTSSVPTQQASTPQASTSSYAASAEWAEDDVFVDEDPDCIDAQDFAVIDTPSPAAPPVAIVESPQPQWQPEVQFQPQSPQDVQVLPQLPSQPQPIQVAQAKPASPSWTTVKHQPRAQLARSRPINNTPTPSPQADFQDDDCPFFIKLLVPPCWIGKMMKKNQQAKMSQPRAKLAASKPANNAETQASSSGGCPLWAKILVPPCWISKLMTDHQQAKASAPTAKLAASKPAEATKKGTARKSDCPPWANLLVPPCWFSHDR